MQSLSDSSNSKLVHLYNICHQNKQSPIGLNIAGIVCEYGVKSSAIHQYNMLTQMKTIYVPALLAEQYLVPAVNHHTRQSRHRQFTLIPAGADNFRYSFFPCTILKWNQLEDSITTAETLLQFKTGLARSSTN